MTPQQANISQQLRDLPQELRRTPKPLSEIIPLLLAAADELDRRAPAPTSEQDAAELAEWRRLKDPAVLHASLLRGQPARLAGYVFQHIAGVEPASESGARDAVAKLTLMASCIEADGLSNTAAELRKIVAALATPASPAALAAPLAPMQKLDYTNYSAPVTMSNSADPAPLVAQASPELPAVLFDAMTVYEETVRWRPHAKISANNVSDVLDAVVRLLKAEAKAAPEASPLVEDAQRIVANVNPADRKK